MKTIFLITGALSFLFLTSCHVHNHPSGKKRVLECYFHQHERDYWEHGQDGPDWEKHGGRRKHEHCEYVWK